MKLTLWLPFLASMVLCLSFTQVTAQAPKKIFQLADIDGDSLSDTLFYQTNFGNGQDSLVRIANTKHLILEPTNDDWLSSVGYSNFWSIYELPIWLWQMEEEQRELLLKQVLKTESNPRKTFEFHPGAEWSISSYEKLLFIHYDSSQFDLIHHVEPKWIRGSFQGKNAVYYYVYESEGITTMLDAMDGSCAVRLAGPTKALIEFKGTCFTNESYPQEVGRSGDYVVKKTPFGLFVEKSDSFYWLYHEDGFTSYRIPELLFPTINDVLVAEGMAFWMVNYDPFNMGTNGFGYYVADLETGRVGSLKGLPQKEGYKFNVIDGQLILKTDLGKQEKTSDWTQFPIEELRIDLRKSRDE